MALRGACAVLLVAAFVGLANAAVVHPKVSHTALKALEANNLTLFSKLAEVAGLRPYLNATVTRATIFAPTDEAIKKAAAAFGVKSPADLLTPERQVLIDRIVGYHIVLDGNLPAAKVTDGAKLTTAGHGTLVASVGQPMTRPVGIPAMPVGSKVVSIKGAQNSAKVVKPDIVAGNVTIHIIDNVLLPHNVFPTIADALAYAGANYSTLASLVKKEPALLKAATDPLTAVTLFAPTNKAFEAPAVQALIKSKPEAVPSVLKYHLVKGAVLVPNFKSKAPEVLPTLLDGQSVTVTKAIITPAKGKEPAVGAVEVTADSAGAKPVKVKKHNIIAGASYIDVIDGVLVPKL